MLKIAVLHPANQESSAPFKDLDPPCDPSCYLPEHHYRHYLISKATAVRQVNEIAQQGFDVVINLCDGAWDEDRAGIEVVQALERLNIAFTGAGSLFYDPSREAMKMAVHSAGVKFPAYVIARQVTDAERAIAHLTFPMIVKHPNSYSSVGLTPDSRVTNAESLRREVARMVEQYNGALIEEFIEGREFTVLVTEPRDETELAWALEPVEFCFPDGESFKHFDLKWKTFEEMTVKPVVDAALAKRLREAAVLSFAALNGSGYARCDFRMDAAGEIYFLEINPYCGIFYPEDRSVSADCILANDPVGHRGFLEHLIVCAKRRQQSNSKPWEIRYRPGLGFGLFATRDIQAGELIQQYEECAHVLASRRHIDRHWRGIQQQWFQQYAYPLTNELYVLWSANPEDWRPLNHSCDPNTWLNNMDMVARRDIASGEELTMDYAMFCGPGMAGFECQCGADNCRRVVMSTDYLLPELQERYRDRASDFVQTAWKQMEPDNRPPYELVPNSVGFGLVARRAWRQGEVISPLSWTKPEPTPSRWTLQLSHTEHAEPLPIELRYINHSCDPNVQFDLASSVVRALRDIEPGDELNFFYPSTEWSMAEAFYCQCGSDRCCGYIAGSAHLPVGLLEQHVLSRIVQEKVKSNVICQDSIVSPSPSDFQAAATHCTSSRE